MQGSFPPASREITGLRTGFPVAGVTIADRGERARYLGALADRLNAPVGEDETLQRLRRFEVRFYLAAIYAAVEAERGIDGAERALRAPEAELVAHGDVLQSCHLRDAVQSLIRITARGVLVEPGSEKDGSLLSAAARLKYVPWAGRATPPQALSDVAQGLLQWRVRENAEGQHQPLLKAQLPPACTAEAGEYVAKLKALGGVVAQLGLARGELMHFLRNPGVLAERHTVALGKLGKEGAFRELCALAASPTLRLYRQAIAKVLADLAE